MSDAAHKTRNNVTGLDSLIDRLKDGTRRDDKLDGAIDALLTDGVEDQGSGFVREGQDIRPARDLTTSVDDCLTLLGETFSNAVWNRDYDGRVSLFTEVAPAAYAMHTDLPRAILIVILEAKKGQA